MYNSIYPVNINYTKHQYKTNNQKKDDELKETNETKDKEINEAKKILALEATKICRGEDEALKAQQTAINIFEQGLAGGELPFISADLTSGISVLDAFLQIGFVSSKGEARRLIKQSGLKINDRVVVDENYIITTDDLIEGSVKLSQGKKKIGLIK